MVTSFNAIMNPDSKSPSDNKIPEFFSADGDKNTEKLSDKKNDGVSLSSTNQKIQERDLMVQFIGNHLELVLELL